MGSTVILSMATALYLFVLNCVSNQGVEQIYLSILPALLFLFILLLAGMFGQHLLKLFVVVSVWIAAVTIFFKWRYHATVTEDIVLSGLINDVSLTTEMLSVPLFLWLALTAFLPMLVIFRMRFHKSVLKVSLSALGGTVVLIGLVAYLQGYTYRAKGQIRDYKQVQAIGSFSPLDIIYAYKKALHAQKILTQKYKQFQTISNHYQEKYPDDAKLIVLIVGESSRGDHFRLNGYDRDTTPRLDHQKGLYSFRHARSCDTLTLRSMNYMFSPLACKDKSNNVNGAAFPNIFKSLGYSVEIYSLQTLNAFYHYLGYDKLLSKYAIVREQQSGTKDISLLPYIKKAVDAYTGGKKLIIVHTLGSHQSYFDRIVRSQELYKPACTHADVTQCSKEELVNAYDNTVGAIDGFVSSVIKMLSNKPAMLVYLSDHGESLGENGYYFHGKPREIAPEEQFRIPFMFWFSRDYSKSREVENFRKNIKKISLDAKVTHDHLYHSILGCAGIVSSDGGIDEGLNLCHE